MRWRSTRRRGERVSRRRARGGGGIAGAVCADAAAAQRLSVGPVWRGDLAEARGSVAGALLQDPGCVQRDAQGAAGRSGAAAVCLCLGGEPCAGGGLCLPAFRGGGGDLHAGDDAAAEDRQDPAVRRRRGRDPAGGGLFRRYQPRGAGLCGRGGGAVPAALRCGGHHRGAGDLCAGGARRRWRRRPT